MAQTEQNQQHPVTKGPSKFDLMIAFFVKPDPDKQERTSSKFAVRFKTDQGEFQREIEVVINSLSWEDGSGESWCFEGYVKKTGSSESVGWTGKQVKGWYRTTNREGFIKLDIRENLAESSKKKIIVHQRSGDVYAQLENDPATWGNGKTPAEAIGNLVQASPESVNVSIEVK